MFIDKNSIMIVYPVTTSSLANPKSLGLYEKVNGAFVLSNDTSIQSGKKYYVSMGQYLVEVEYQYNKLWGSDSGRNLKGEMTGSLVGVFPKLVMQFRKLTQRELQIVTLILDTPTQEITYYDAHKKTYVTMETYSSDWGVSNKTIVNTTNGHKNEGFSASFIARKKRS